MAKKKTKTLRSNDFNFDLFEKAIEEAGYTKRGLSTLIGASKNYLSVCFSPSRKYIPEQQAKLICALIGREIEEFLIDEKEDNKAIQQPLPTQEEKFDPIVTDYLRVMTLCLQKMVYEWTGEEVM